MVLLVARAAVVRVRRRVDKEENEKILEAGVDSEAVAILFVSFPKSMAF